VDSVSTRLSGKDLGCRHWCKPGILTQDCNWSHEVDKRAQGRGG
jgi:hypothetical protein